MGGSGAVGEGAPVLSVRDECAHEPDEARGFARFPVAALLAQVEANVDEGFFEAVVGVGEVAGESGGDKAGAAHQIGDGVVAGMVTGEFLAQAFELGGVLDLCGLAAARLKGAVAEGEELGQNPEPG